MILFTPATQYLAQGHVCYCDDYQHGVTLALT